MQWQDPVAWPRLISATAAVPRAFYARPAPVVARELLGKVLVHGRAGGQICETEAYLGREDKAAHACRGVTARTRVLFGPPGHAYVYFVYGMHECLNLVSEAEGVPGCVLIRAVEPLCGLAIMRRRRRPARHPEELCSGPGKLARAFGVNRKHYGADVTVGSLQVREWLLPRAFQIDAGPRIGIRQSAGLPLRFVIRGSRFVSRPPP